MPVFATHITLAQHLKVANNARIVSTVAVGKHGI